MPLTMPTAEQHLSAARLDLLLLIQGLDEIKVFALTLVRLAGGR
jgi:hypothetical protein